MGSEGEGGWKEKGKEGREGRGGGRGEVEVVRVLRIPCNAVTQVAT